MGSLFKLRDYWYSRYPGEEFGHTSALTVGNADNDSSGDEKIIIGSFTGLLRILQPMKKGEAGPADTLIEKDFRAPILQVACRPLEPVSSSGCPRNLLAVLLPTRLVLVRMSREGDMEQVDGGLKNFFSTNYRLSVYHEAHLESTSYNFTCGTFGHASHELVCVQSMDGRLTIVDHNTVVLQCLLPTSQFLLPGCLAYCPQRDYFLTNNSALNLMCYSFAALTTNRLNVMEGVNDIEGTSSEFSGDALTPTWTFNLGEDVVGIEICRHTRGLEEGDVDIVVLCYHTLFVLQPNGILRFSRHMDVEGLCITSYPLPNADACNLLIGTIMGTVNVYSDMSLDWSAKMTTTASQCLRVAEFFKTSGMIVSLSTNGTVSVNYLGTDPVEDPIQPIESKKMDYEEMERETRRVLRAIKRSSNNSDMSPVKEVMTKEQLQVEWRTPSAVLIREKDEFGVTVILTLCNTNQSESFEEVMVVVHVVEPIQVDVGQRVLNKVMPGDVVQIPFLFNTKDNKDMIVPSSLEARAVAMYINNCNVTCTVSDVVRLPFALVARPIPPVMDLHFMMQLNTEKDVPASLLDLFHDMTNSSEVTASLMTVQYVNGADATVLVSKNACRFRLKASTMEALWLIGEELQNRLVIHYNSDVQLNIPDPIPLEDYFSVIDTHLAVRKEMMEAYEALSRAANMFRAVQKRLLHLVRERNPTPVRMMDVLLEESYKNLQKCADNVSNAMPRQKQAAAMLCCCSRLVLMQLLIKCQETLKDRDTISRLKSIFTCAVSVNSDVSWEEVTDAALSYFFLPVGERCVTGHNSSLNFDSGRLKKHISALFNRLLDGFHIAFT